MSQAYASPLAQSQLSASSIGSGLKNRPIHQWHVSDMRWRASLRSRFMPRHEVDPIKNEEMAYIEMPMSARGVLEARGVPMGFGSDWSIFELPPSVPHTPSLRSPGRSELPMTRAELSSTGQWLLSTPREKPGAATSQLGGELRAGKL